MNRKAMLLNRSAILMWAMGVVAMASLGNWEGNAIAQELPMPESWRQAWAAPPLECRPLQIVHGLTAERIVADGVAQILQQPTAQPVSDEGMAYYLRRGRGGIVCNVAFQDYLRSEAKTLSQNVSGTECNPGAGEVEKRKIVLSFLFPTN